METIFLIIIFTIFGVILLLGIIKLLKWIKMSPEERLDFSGKQINASVKINIENEYGYLNPEIICPHCQKQGNVRTKQVKLKKGISGAKTTGALLTGGVSILATGLSRKEKLTQAYCSNCKSKWHF